MTHTNDPYAHLPDEVHPFKNFTPRQNPPRHAEKPLKDVTIEFEKIDAMTLEELKHAVKRFARLHGLVACMSEEETAQAMLDRLASIALRKDANGLVRDTTNAINSWLDRVKGKPVATINQNTTITLEQLVLASYNGPKDAKVIEHENAEILTK